MGLIKLAKRAYYKKMADAHARSADKLVEVNQYFQNQHGAVDNSTPISRETLASKIDNHIKNKNTPLFAVKSLKRIREELALGPSKYDLHSRHELLELAEILLKAAKRHSQNSSEYLKKIGSN
jgi:hypothetical protein